MTILPILFLIGAIFTVCVLAASKRPFFAFLCVIGTFAWGILSWFVIAFSGWGDGSGGDAIVGNNRLLLYSPSVFLLFYVVASTRFIPAWLEHTILLIATISLLFFSVFVSLKVSDSIKIVWVFVFYCFSAYWPWFKQKKTDKTVQSV